MLTKYPRTFHFNFSPEIHSDDKVIHLKYLGNFLNKEVIITEKMDGQNNCMKGLYNNEYPGVFARTHAVETKLPWDHFLISYYHNNKYNLKENTWYFLENMFAIHSIEYNKLNNYMFLFALYNQKTNMFLSWNETELEAERLNIPTPEVLYRGKFKSMADVQKWMDREIRKPSKYGEKREGFVLRITDSFPADKFQEFTAKYVRKNHVQTDKHWRENWKKATLKKS